MNTITAGQVYSHNNSLVWKFYLSDMLNIPNSWIGHIVIDERGPTVLIPADDDDLTELLDVGGNEDFLDDIDRHGCPLVG